MKTVSGLQSTLGTHNQLLSSNCRCCNFRSYQVPWGLRFRCLRHWTFHLGFAAEVHFASTYHPGVDASSEVELKCWESMSPFSFLGVFRGVKKRHLFFLGIFLVWSMLTMLGVGGSQKEALVTILSGDFLVSCCMYMQATQKQTHYFGWVMIQWFMQQLWQWNTSISTTLLAHVETIQRLVHRDSKKTVILRH